MAIVVISKRWKKYQKSQTGLILFAFTSVLHIKCIQIEFAFVRVIFILRSSWSDRSFIR